MGARGSSTTTGRRGLTPEQRRERHDALMDQLAGGVAAPATDEGWRRYLRAVATLREYSSGNSGISQTREYTCYQLMAAPARQRYEPFGRPL